MNQRIAISGLGGQGVLFITRVLAETALDMGRNVLSSETHGMAMRGGAVISHLKVGAYRSPLIGTGAADVALFLAGENLSVHGHLIGEATRVIVNTPDAGAYPGVDADRIAEAAAGRRTANLVLLGYALGLGLLFTPAEPVQDTIRKLGRSPEAAEANLRALQAGLTAAIG
jgi:indolepyruvate ferredoxin oxidoreductase beta subunit